MEQSERGLSTTSVTLLFLLGVAVCAVFFSFGFLLGYKERSFSHTPEVERVTPTGDTPPVVNPPPEREEISAGQEANTPLPTVQPPAAASGQKSESVASQAKASAQDAARAGGGQADRQLATAAVGKGDSGEVPGSTLPSRTAGLVLQVAAMQARQDADALVKTLKARGYPVFLVPPEEAGANDKFFRVRVGPFASRDKAESVRNELLAEGFKPFIKR